MEEEKKNMKDSSFCEVFKTKVSDILADEGERTVSGSLGRVEGRVELDSFCPLASCSLTNQVRASAAGCTGFFL